MKKSNLILLFNSNNKVYNLTKSSIVQYSEKINVDLIEIQTEDEWDKFRIEKYFEEYQRILLLNSNLIIRPDTPNLFDMVPKTHLGAFNESRYIYRVNKIQNVFDQNNLKIDSWDGEYYNTGVVLISRSHKEFLKIPKNITSDFTSYFNFVLQKNKIKVHDITYKFNRVHYVDKHIGISRLGSYIIHYQDAPESLIYENINNDLNQWKEDFPHFKYKQNFVISVSAGMGDQLCSEPAIRYTQKLYPDANFYILTHFPRLFSHLNIPTFTHEEWDGIDETFLKLYTCPDETVSEHNMSHVLFHPTDFASMSMIRRTIPNNEKTIKLELNSDDTLTILNYFKNKDPKKPLIVVHAGKWWESKTFPSEWWQEVVDRLSEKLTVCLVGKTIDERQGYVPIECPLDGYDLRDMTSLGELFSVISLSKVLLTNDSSPLHIAGAFDNWIVTIPTCKHPDHILPFRNGTQYYKTKALYKKLLLDDLEIRHTELSTDTIDLLPKGKSISEYLPEVDDLIKEIFDIYENHD
jgi:hypothetical protein